MHPEVARRAAEALRRRHGSWEDLFDAADSVRDVGEAPHGVARNDWPRLAEHIARAERVREVVRSVGAERAGERFGRSPHAVERAALLEERVRSAPLAPDDEAEVVAGILACPVDEHLAYGHLLSRLVELCAHEDPGGTVRTFESFVRAAEEVDAQEPSWPERLRVARDGLAALYVRVGRLDEAEAVFQERFEEDPGDTSTAIGAARAYLGGGEVGYSIRWLERAAERARRIGRLELARDLEQKIRALRARLC